MIESLNLKIVDDELLLFVGLYRFLVGYHHPISNLGTTTLTFSLYPSSLFAHYTDMFVTIFSGMPIDMGPV